MASPTHDLDVQRDEGTQEELAAACPKNAHPCPVVAIGASAGGLEAFQEFFRHMPADTGLAFVLLQHLSPRHQTLIPELLAPLTPMPVRQVTEETVIEANHVYVMPPNLTLTIDDCVLYATKQPRMRGRRSPIDRFFRSLAEDQEDEAVGVILSGSGTDGALGLKAIKERGGLTMVQSPQMASHDGMPRSAVLTGAVDHVLPVAEMPGKLIEHLARLREGQGGSSERFREEVAGYLGKICGILRRETGHDFRRYKHSTLVRRVRRRLNESRSTSIYDYVESLSSDTKEVDQLFRDLLISVTNFFRDPETFNLLAAKVVPRLSAGKDADGYVRVWVPGCATGEEAYSLAILLHEHLAGLKEPPHVQVFATDIDTQALEIARQAWYPETIAGQISPERLERFFVKQGNMYQVSREIRDVCLFSLHNLIADPPFSRLDLISCRNLLIYLESELQKKVLALFHYALRPGGYLFLGPSEMASGQPELFRTLDKKHRIFQSRDTVAHPPFSFSLGERTRLGHRPAEDSQRRPVPRQQEVARTFEAVLLESYAPACVVVNEWGNGVYFSPRTGRYLEPAPGAPTVNVIDMARQGLRLDVRTALHKAVSSRVPVVHENVAFELDGQMRRVNVIVRPLPELGEDPGLFMVVFQDVVAAGEPSEPGTIAADDAMVRRLESELRATKDHLQATMEELESSNEELVSSNEELLSMKEEVQSVNEELETVNAELKKKLEELDRANSDLQNYFQSTRIASLFVDRELCIKKFTPAATEVFRLIDGDIGRPIADIAPRFSGGDLLAEIRAVLRNLAPHERQVRAEDGAAWFLLRILPYRTLDDVIDGVVLTFLDITELKRAEEVLRQEARRKDEFLAMLGHELRNPLAPIRNCLHILRSPRATDEQNERARRTIERQTFHLTRLVDDLLDISRVSQGKILLRKERLDLVQVVRSTVEDQRPQLAAAGLTLELDLADVPLRVEGDPTRLSQVIGNVVQNAVKFTERGGRIFLAVREASERGAATITVRDSGIGMEPELLARIFEPFSQAERTLDRGRGGLGLGLFLVKALIEQHGGSVEATSAGLGRGSELTLRLPLAAGIEETAMAEQTPISAPEGTRRCLVIEDHEDAAESLALLLRLVGHEAEVAFDAGEGLEKARQFRPDFVLCDIGLPGAMDGYDLARAFRADADLRSVYLIALTGYGQEEDRRRAMEAGFDAHLTKPADLDALRRLLAGGGLNHRG